MVTDQRNGTLEEGVQEQPLEPYARELEIRQIAATLLRAVWNGIEAEYLSKYRMTIWTQFEERVGAASRMTNSLLAFLSKLAMSMQVAEIGRDATERLHVELVLAGKYGSPGEILAALRRDPQICVMLLRIQKEQERIKE
ncbi:hypothetical protein KSF_109760 [Reticulibacter mediterranei]|uniref:Uncharacterized protein n=1 Tax=Reticulibacter mediterranei TaxID=2778369 RepID=A0A8J3N9L5_9CHLR|nr:hypothetical protein [Reticulibacter mediterranei]GHP00929.1 hypothetical protein KSF_109760 [Reticulibacter mediterranei]